MTNKSAEAPARFPCDCNACELNRAKSENARLTAEVERLRAALLPFASIQSQMGDYVGYPDNIIVRIEASVGELRRARAAVAIALEEAAKKIDDLPRSSGGWYEYWHGYHVALTNAAAAIRAMIKEKSDDASAESVCPSIRRTKRPRGTRDV